MADTPLPAKVMTPPYITINKAKYTVKEGCSSLPSLIHGKKKIDVSLNLHYLEFNIVSKLL